MRGLAAALALLFLSGCVDLGKEFAERRFYSLDVTRSGAPGAVPKGTVLEVRRFRISRRYEAQELVYRKGDQVYETDFYHAFFVPPATNLTEETREWMARSGRFEHVVEAGSRVGGTHVLEGSVSELCGDFRGEGAGRAVLELQFFLILDAEAVPKILFKKTYRREPELRERTAAALVAGWQKGLGEILAEFEGDLTGVK